MVDLSAHSDGATETRNALANKLLSDAIITSPVAERAFRVLPRHLFVPVGTLLKVAYYVGQLRWRSRETKPTAR